MSSNGLEQVFSRSSRRLASHDVLPPIFSKNWAFPSQKVSQLSQACLLFQAGSK